MSTKIELKGQILRIGETQNWDSGFCKREVVIECGNEKYENPIPVEATKDKCAILDKFKAGDIVEISGYLNGNYYDKTDRYFLALRLSFIKHSDAEQKQPEPTASNKHNPKEEENLPF